MFLIGGKQYVCADWLKYVAESFFKVIVKFRNTSRVNFRAEIKHKLALRLDTDPLIVMSQH